MKPIETELGAELPGVLAYCGTRETGSPLRHGREGGHPSGFCTSAALACHACEQRPSLTYILLKPGRVAASVARRSRDAAMTMEGFLHGTGSNAAPHHCSSATARRATG